MREILFRAKDSTGNWVFGYFVKDYEGNAYITELNGSTTCNVDESTLGQYTGLKDKNGKMIFEGDLIREYDSGQPIKVFFNESTACYDIEYTDTGECDQLCYRKDNTLYEVEIIGNIHDKPELLNTEKC